MRMSILAEAMWAHFDLLNKQRCIQANSDSSISLKDKMQERVENKQLGEGNQ